MNCLVVGPGETLVISAILEGDRETRTETIRKIGEAIHELLPPGANVIVLDAGGIEHIAVIKTVFSEGNT